MSYGAHCTNLNLIVTESDDGKASILHIDVPVLPDDDRQSYTKLTKISKTSWERAASVVIIVPVSYTHLTLPTNREV